MIIRNHDFVGATLAVALSNVMGRGKPCPYNIKRPLCAEIFVFMYTIDLKSHLQDGGRHEQR